jgi:hypothetical protein
MRSLSALVLAILASGCGMMKAPDVGVPSKRQMSAADLGLASLCPATEAAASSICGSSVEISLKQESPQDHWAYWKAGAASMVYQASEQFAGSADWDMRVTKYFPLIGSNGGETARDEGFAGGKAAFSVIPDSMAGFVPHSVSDIKDLAFTADRNEGLEFEGTKLAPEYQNPVVNAIGAGIVRRYDMRDHSVELSQRVFVLRATDGASYFAIRFNRYSRRDKKVWFEWRKLQ